MGRMVLKPLRIGCHAAPEPACLSVPMASSSPVSARTGGHLKGQHRVVVKGLGQDPCQGELPLEPAATKRIAMWETKIDLTRRRRVFVKALWGWSYTVPHLYT